jgi:hypothetical protein
MKRSKFLKATYVHDRELPSQAPHACYPLQTSLQLVDTGEAISVVHENSRFWNNLERKPISLGDLCRI